MEAEAERLEKLLGSVHSKVGSDGMMRSRSSASLARASGRAEAGDVVAVDAEAQQSSPAKRMEAIHLLSREVRQGGRVSRVPDNLMLLPSLAREEGNL